MPPKGIQEFPLIKVTTDAEWEKTKARPELLRKSSKHRLFGFAARGGFLFLCVF